MEGPVTQYKQRDVRALDANGGHYSRHVAAMTEEGLVAKSDIAAELAWRDARIAELEALVTEMETAFVHGVKLFREQSRVIELAASVESEDAG